MNSGKCTIAQSSVTYAMKSERILFESGIDARIVRLTPEQARNGCSFGLEISCKNLNRAISLLQSKGLGAKAI